MNIALEQTKEYVDGQLLQTYGDAFIRGNNGMRSYIRY
jgi:U6 snRNA-associated Sm-like protein LSm6